MTRAKAADVAQAIINAGFAPTIIGGPTPETGWRIRVEAVDGVAVEDVAAFATGQAVTARVKFIELV